MTDILSFQERADRIESGAKRASAVLSILLSGMQSDDRLPDAMIEDTIAAAIELLQMQ